MSQRVDMMNDETPQKYPEQPFLGQRRFCLSNGKLMFYLYDFLLVFRGGSLSRSGCVTQSVSQSVTESRFSNNNKKEH